MMNWIITTMHAILLVILTLVVCYGVAKLVLEVEEISDVYGKSDAYGQINTTTN